MGIFRKDDSGGLCQFTASEVKIVLIFCYFLASMALLWTSITYGISKHHETAIKIGTYKQCLANGVHEELDCEIYREQLEAISLRPLAVMYLVLIAFLNISNLPLIIEYKSVKKTIILTLGLDTVKEAEIPSRTT